MALVLPGRRLVWEQCQKHRNQDKKLISHSPMNGKDRIAAAYLCAAQSPLPSDSAPPFLPRTSSARADVFDPSFSPRTHSSLLSSYESFEIFSKTVIVLLAY